MGPQQPLLSRRDLLLRSGMGFGALALADLLGSPRLAAAASDPLAPRAPHFAPRAKRVLHIFCSGGPSQMETFDPKPALNTYAATKRPLAQAGQEPRMVLACPFSFKKHGQSGIDVSEVYPHLASVVDELCVVRSMKSDTGSHSPATLLMNTGQMQLPRPSVGAWVTYGLGTENRNLPAFVVLAPGGPTAHGARNWQASFLPGAFQGTFVSTAQADPLKMMPDLRRAEGGARDQREQLDLAARLNRRHQQGLPEDPRLEGRIQSFELAFRMQSEAIDAFDVSTEPESVRRSYGTGPEARMFMIARRLLERGVRYVQVWSAGWDHHEDLAVRLKESATIQDQPIAALLKDLQQRGLLEETIVVWGGEFGRTPTSQPPLADGTLARLNGRDHNPQGFTMWLAGGGVKRGAVHGATDEMGSIAVEKPVHVHDLHATILRLLGFDHEKLTYRYADRDFRLTDVHGKVVREILA